MNFSSGVDREIPGCRPSEVVTPFEDADWKTRYVKSQNST